MIANALPHPRLPRLFSLLGRRAPTVVHSRVFAGVLNKLLATPLREGELEFLEGRVLQVGIRDTGLRFRLSLAGGRLTAPSGEGADITIDGDLYDFLLLVTRREDPDTLFFNRRLKLGGDTELGLYVKNFLDALEPEPSWQPLLTLAGQAATAMERVGALTAPKHRP